RRAPLSPPVFRAWLRCGWTEDPVEAWRARDGAGEVRGWYLLGLPERENQHQGSIVRVVAASRRGAGLGTALLGHAADRARHASRTLLTSHTKEASAGAAFARAMGARHRFTGAFWALRPRSLPAGRLAALRESAASAGAGYSLVSWEGAVAEDRLAEVAAPFDAEADAPHPEGEDPPSWDPARVRAADRRIAEQGRRFYTVAARADRTGRLVAITQLGVDPLDGSAFQKLTAVTAPHRGHRLGGPVEGGVLEVPPADEPRRAQAGSPRSASK